jgi:hypothetical protein
VFGVVNPDLTRAYNHVLTAAGAVFIGQPVGPYPPRFSRVCVQVLQDGNGSRVVTWASCWRDAPSWGSNGPASASAVGEFISDGQGSYQYAGGSSAFAVVGTGLAPGTGAAQITGQSATRTP